MNEFAVVTNTTEGDTNVTRFTDRKMGERYADLVESGMFDTTDWTTYVIGTFEYHTDNRPSEYALIKWALDDRAARR